MLDALLVTMSMLKAGGLRSKTKLGMLAVVAHLHIGGSFMAALQCLVMASLASIMCRCLLLGSLCARHINPECAGAV